MWFGVTSFKEIYIWKFLCLPAMLYEPAVGVEGILLLELWCYVKHSYLVCSTEKAQRYKPKIHRQAFTPS